MRIAPSIEDTLRFTLTVNYPGKNGNYAVRFPARDLSSAAAHAKTFIDRMILPAGSRAVVSSNDDTTVHVLLHS